MSAVIHSTPVPNLVKVDDSNRRQILLEVSEKFFITIHSDGLYVRVPFGLGFNLNRCSRHGSSLRDKLFIAIFENPGSVR